jgi:CBS domain-containing protein
METTINELIRINGRRVHSVSPQNSLKETLQLMADYKIGAVLVVDTDGTLVGVFSERDFARKSIEHTNLSMDMPIRELMTREVITVRPEQTVQQCMEFVTRMRIRHLPVVDDNALIGMVSIGDLVKAAIAEKEALIAEKQSLIQRLEGYISGSIA